MSDAKRPRRILVVEDDLDQADLVRRLLVAEGFVVEVAHSGFHALCALEELKPDIALVDIGLPGFDGFQLSEAIRGAPGLSDIWIFAVTGRTDLITRKRAHEAGIDMFFTKPLDEQDLLEVVRSLGVRPPVFVAEPFD